MTLENGQVEPESGAIIIQRLAELGQISDERGALTRTFLSPAMRRVGEKVGEWMRAAGMEVCSDDWGNLIGRLACIQSGAKTLLLGSHLDTVRNAGRYDGPLGVLLAISVCDVLRRMEIRLPFHLDVIGFSDEEGVRFHSAYLGSKAVAGLIGQEDFKMTDANGITLAEAIGSQADLPLPRYAAGELLGYVEAHMEQGPILEAEGFALGIVTAIAAQCRLSCTFGGQAGHAGTTPMRARHDALAGAAEFIARVEKFGLGVSGLVATVGHLEVWPNVSNVIVESAVLSVDIRHANRNAVTSLVEMLAREGAALANARGLKFSLLEVQSSKAVACDRRLTAALVRSIEQVQPLVPQLVSGAGHDGVILSHLGPIAMLFIRCRDGLSHHPNEHVAPEDIALALRALTTFVRDFT